MNRCILVLLNRSEAGLFTLFRCFTEACANYEGDPIAQPPDVVIGVYPSTSPIVKKLFAFQTSFWRPSNCTIQYRLCHCGLIHCYLHSTAPLAAQKPLHVGDPPFLDLDFILHFDGGSFQVGGAEVALAISPYSTLYASPFTPALMPPMPKRPEQQEPFSWLLNTLLIIPLLALSSKGITDQSSISWHTPPNFGEQIFSKPCKKPITSWPSIFRRASGLQQMC